METLHVETRSRCELRDITAEVREVVRARALHEGIVVVYCPHTTAGIARNPGAAGAMFINFILAMALIESIAIYGLVVALMLVGRLPG